MREIRKKRHAAELVFLDALAKSFTPEAAKAALGESPHLIGGGQKKGGQAAV